MYKISVLIKYASYKCPCWRIPQVYICFGWEIRKLFFWNALLTKDLLSSGTRGLTFGQSIHLHSYYAVFCLGCFLHRLTHKISKLSQKVCICFLMFSSFVPCFNIWHCPAILWKHGTLIFSPTIKFLGRTLLCVCKQWHNFGPDLGPNCLTLWWFIEKVDFEKKKQ